MLTLVERGGGEAKFECGECGEKLPLPEQVAFLPTGEIDPLEVADLAAEHDSFCGEARCTCERPDLPPTTPLDAFPVLHRLRGPELDAFQGCESQHPMAWEFGGAEKNQFFALFDFSEHCRTCGAPVLAKKIPPRYRIEVYSSPTMYAEHLSTWEAKDLEQGVAMTTLLLTLPEAQARGIIDLAFRHSWVT